MKNRSFVMAMNIAKQYSNRQTTNFFETSYQVMQGKMRRNFKSPSKEEVLELEEKTLDAKKNYVMGVVKQNIKELDDEIGKVVDKKITRFQQDLKTHADQKQTEFEETINSKLSGFNESKKVIDQQIEKITEEHQTINKKLEDAAIETEKQNKKLEENSKMMEKHDKKLARHTTYIGIASFAISTIVYFRRSFASFISDLAEDAGKKFHGANYTQEKLVAIKKREQKIQEIKKEHDSFWPIPFFRDERSSRRRQISELEQEIKKLSHGLDQPKCTVKNCLEETTDHKTENSLTSIFGQ